MTESVALVWNPCHLKVLFITESMQTLFTEFLLVLFKISYFATLTTEKLNLLKKADGLITDIIYNII